MTTLEQTNNHAASLISSGRCLEAYDELNRVMGDVARQITLNDAIVPPCNDPILVVAPISPILTCSDSSCAFSSPLLFAGDGTDEVDLSAETLSCAFATALFNMALAIQSATDSVVPLGERTEALWQCQMLYRHAYDIVENLDLPLLRLAVCNNLLDLAFEQADLHAVKNWTEKFNQSMENDSFEVPVYALLHFLKVQLYFMPSLNAARTA